MVISFFMYIYRMSGISRWFPKFKIVFLVVKQSLSRGLTIFMTYIPSTATHLKFATFNFFYSNHSTIFLKNISKYDTKSRYVNDENHFYAQLFVHKLGAMQFRVKIMEINAPEDLAYSSLLSLTNAVFH